MSLEPVQHEPEIPPRLAEAIRRCEPGAGSGGMDLARLDRAVLEEAGRRLGVRRRGGRAVIWRIGGVGGAVAAAAGLALAVYVAWPRPGGGVGQTPSAMVAFDASKPVTILDAFMLARLLEGRTGSGAAGISPTWDVTADGLIDQRDVDAIAARAVRLGGADGRVGSATGTRVSDQSPRGGRQTAGSDLHLHAKVLSPAPPHPWDRDEGGGA